MFKGVTLGQYLQEQGYSESFKNNYVLPMCAAVWSVPNVTVRTCRSSCAGLSLSWTARKPGAACSSSRGRWQEQQEQWQVRLAANKLQAIDSSDAGVLTHDLL